MKCHRLKCRVLPLLLLLLAACAAGSSHLAHHWSAPAEAQLQAADLFRHVQALAAPAMEGRASGTPGGERAAAYIAAEFAGAGLTPGGEAGSYFQPFEVITGIRLGPANALTVGGLPPPMAAPFVVGRDFIPLSFSAEGGVEGEVLFAGYGITAPEIGYDDYAGQDAAGKVVLVMTHEPRERDEGGPFRRPEAYRHTEARTKVTAAREHGAAAVLLVRDPNNHRGEPEELIGLRGASSSRSSLLAVNITAALADRLLEAAGKRLADLQTAIDAGLAPRSLPLPAVRVRLSVDLIREKGRAANVVGLLPGRDPALRETAVVIGAHYDHLGRGGEASLAPDTFGTIHPGADDNASGTAVVLGLARAFAAVGGAPRTLIFAAFAGEEMGLLGSSFYTRHPAIPLERMVAMLNLDMVGRLRDGKVLVGGVESAREWPGILQAAARGLPLTLAMFGDAYGPSDHTAFAVKERPVLFFFTGPHEDYHRPSDTHEKINVAGLQQMATLVYRTAAVVAGEPAAPAFVRAPARPPAAGQRQGYGPYFGSIPDFGATEVQGVQLSGVRPGSPAERAGLRAGDTIVRFGGVRVTNLEDLVYALRAKRAGDTVEVVYRRDGQEQASLATLEQRR
jgi:hypothetical protein